MIIEKDLLVIKANIVPTHNEKEITVKSFEELKTLAKQNKTPIFLTESLPLNKTKWCNLFQTSINGVLYNLAEEIPQKLKVIEYDVQYIPTENKFMVQPWVKPYWDVIKTYCIKALE